MYADWFDSSFEIPSLPRAYRILVMQVGALHWKEVEKRKTQNISAFPWAIFQRVALKRTKQITQLLYSIEQDQRHTFDPNKLVCDFIDPSLYIQELSGYWIPSVVSWSPTKQCKFESEIANVDRFKYPQVTDALGRVLTKVCQLWEALDLLEFEPQLQIIVKAQSYNLKEGKSFASQLQRMGVSWEKIIAVGVWCYQVDACLCAEIELALQENIEEKTTVNLEQNSIVVFKNMNLYHRILPMQYKQDTINSTHSQTAQVKMLSFFLVDPMNPSTVDASSVPELNQRFAVAAYLDQFPQVLIHMVTEYLMPEKQAIQQAIEWSLSREKSMKWIRGIEFTDDESDESGTDEDIEVDSPKIHPTSIAARTPHLTTALPEAGFDALFLEHQVSQHSPETQAPNPE